MLCTHPMKKLLTVLLLLTTVAIVIAQSSTTAESLDKDITTHFEKYEPELFRYSGLTVYGEIKTIFEKDQVDKELLLFNQIKNSGLIGKPTENVFALCHNVIIHSPDEGKEFLKLLNRPTNDKQIISLLYSEIMFAGEYGEQLALDNLESENESWSRTWSNYLSSKAIYQSSIPRIEMVLTETNDLELKEDLIGALMYISNPQSKEIVKQIIETTPSDQVQAKAIFAFVELSGYDGISYLQSIKTKGEKSKLEKKGSIDWLKKETNSKNKFGTEVSNDIDFIMRFGDIKSPAILWLDKEGLLNEESAKKPKPLAKEKKDKLIDLLIESKGFGLEAAKGQLFLSIEPTDLNRLLTLRQMCLYSPNDMTQGRLKTIGIFIRSLRKRV